MESFQFRRQMGNFKGVLDADHLDLVGITLGDTKNKFDHLKHLDSIAGILIEKGFLTKSSNVHLGSEIRRPLEDLRKNLFRSITG